ncbi:hypothetical protein LWT11_02095 [Enterobacter roggenkampii]|uniref:hypothetical protein n=1 Tax=Enterobacter roggenkampii TaxID=1812935 RepID=UPI001E554D67|nr:hypothetical protein [Enterobacter roggenkampii]MCE1986695.1 hypothetical protein [Enterobacter roggenkampii]
MSATKKNSTEVDETSIKAQEQKDKKCFAIMPIADHADYDNGHFTRVYNHLIKPACEQAGFSAVRADDAKASHMIMFDILKNIVECDMAICDLSSKNPNVFYELGLRQAFNKKTILITDGKTTTPFDITGFRYVKYDPSLRIDTVMKDISEIAAMLKETDEASEDDINSIVKLLRLQPAKLEHVQLNEQDTMMFRMIQRLDDKMSRIEDSQKKQSRLNPIHFDHTSPRVTASDINDLIYNLKSYDSKVDLDKHIFIKYKDHKDNDENND